MNQHLALLSDLAPFLRAPAQGMIEAIARDLKFTMRVTFTWRSFQTQLSIYEKGREYDRAEGVWKVVDEKLIVTKAKPGSSPHNVITMAGAPAAVALDMVPMAPNGELLWGTAKTDWQKIWKIAWKFGFDPLGDSIGAYYEPDLGHFEEPGWKAKLDGLQLLLPDGVTQRV